MFSLLEIFRITVSQLLFPQIKHCLEICAASRANRLFIMALYHFSRRRLPEVVTEELVFVLSQKGPYEFKKLFEVVYDNLRGRNAAFARLLQRDAYKGLLVGTKAGTN
jgi:hypothetical protein